MAQDTDWGAILNGILGLAPAVAGGIQAFGGGQSGAIGQSQNAAAMADPFAAQRGLYQGQLAQTLGSPGGAPNPYANMLQGLLTDPNSFKTDPGYQFALGQGQEAVSRGSNALYGTGRTGSLGPELAKFTEGYANQAYDKRIDQLAGLSGQQQNYNANLMKELLTASGADQGNPYGAGQLLMGGYQGQNNGIAALLNGLTGKGGYGPSGGIGGLLNSILGQGGGGGMGGGMVDPSTGMVMYGSGPNASVGMGGQGGWPGEADWTSSGAPDWSNLFGFGGTASDPWYG